MTTIRCRVILLDDTIIERDLEKKAVGQVLFDEVCEYLNLLESDYFGLATWDSSKTKLWLDLSKAVHKQIKGHDATFTFSVKFYPPDPSEVAEDITRYLLCLQLREDILTSRLPCPSYMLAVLGSYMIQSEYGDHNPDLHGKENFRNIPFAPDQTPELEEEVIELHRSLKSMSPAEADQLFLQNIKTLVMYGVHLHPAKDASGEDVMLGVCADGLMVYKEEENTQCFIWPSVLNMSYRRSNFQARILHSEQDTFENVIKFSLPSYRACKCLWKNAVEHHAFFRNLKKAPEKLLHLGSRFRFQGLTHAESLEASSTIKRPAPPFSRSALKRKAKESFLVSLKRPSRSESDDWFQVLGSNKPWPTYNTDKEEPSGGETLAYKGEDGLNNELLGSKVDNLDNEWVQLFGGHHLASFPTQQSLPTLSSDTDILESAKLQLWKLQADDWFVLLEPHTYQLPNPWLVTASLQSSQTEEHREELKWSERTSEMNIKVFQEGKEFVSEQHEELEMERNLMRPYIVREELDSDTRTNEQIRKVMWEKIESEGGGVEICTQVMYEQGTQIIETYSGQSQEAFVEQRMRGMEEVDALNELRLKTGQVVSENNIEELKETLLEVESIEQKLRDIERLKVRLQEVDMLERRQLQESDDWYILLEHKRRETSAPARLLRVGSFEQKMPNIEWKRQERGERNDWYLLLECKPLMVSSACAGHSMDTAEEKAEIRSWIETERRRVNTVMPVQMKDDWHTLLELLPRSSQTMKPALPPSDVDVYKETRQEEEQSVEKQVKTITYNEERRETTEIAHEMTQMNLVPSAPMTLISDDAASVGPQQTVTIKEKAMIMRETQVTVGEQEWKNHATVREVEDNWFALFTPVQIEKKVIATEPVTLIYEDAEAGLRLQRTVSIKGEEVTFEETPTIIRETHVIIEEKERKSPAGVREGEGDWFLHFMPETIEKKVTATVPMTLISEDAAGPIPQRVTIKEKEVIFEKKPTIIEEKQVIVKEVEKNIRATAREVEDNWFVLFTPVQIEKKLIATVPMTLISEDAAGPIPQRVTIKEKEVMFEKKPTIIEEKQVIVKEVEKNIRATAREVEDNWFVLFTPVQIEKKVTGTGGVSDKWILEENRLREVQEQRLIEDARRSHVVEDRRLPAYVPEAKAGEHHREVIDDWFILLEPFSKTSVSEDRRAVEERRRKEELLKKRAMAEDRRKVAGFIVPLTPADQPMTSTPTAQSVRITRPTYQDESLKRLDITQEITQNINEESKVETESAIKRKRRDKRVEGESIYIRHSILMLEDSDVTQEVLLRHHASVRELKRIFMEDMPVSGPTEWDRRLSSYAPVVYPKLSNGNLFTDIMSADELLAM